MAIPERLHRAVEMMDCKPSDDVLEIGCGRGHAVELLCARLTKGTVTAIDRSAKAIFAAAERNADAVKRGQAIFRNVALEDAEFSPSSFDKVLAVHVNLFWTRVPDRELTALRSWIAPRGKLFLCWEPLSGDGSDLALRVSAPLRAAGFTVKTKRSGALLCIIGAQ